MVKNKKILKRVSALVAVALLLLVGVAPALMPAANAFVIVPERDENGELLTPVLYQMSIPLDVLQSDIHGIVVDNPMFSVAVDNGHNQWTQIGMPDLELYEHFWGDPLKIWDFHLSSLSSYSNHYLAGFVFQIDSSVNSNLFTLKNSAPFVATMKEVARFLQLFEYWVRPGYEVCIAVSFDGMYPKLVSEGGWELVPFNFQETYSFSNMSNKDAWVKVMSSFDSSEFDIDVLFESGMTDKLLSFSNFSLSFDCYNSMTDGIGDDGNFVAASSQSLRFLVSSPDSAHTFVEFFDRYPGHRVIVSDSPGAADFNLTVFLKNSVGSFMETEIIPGISFGGLLAVAIGLSLTVVFLKFFGG